MNRLPINWRSNKEIIDLVKSERRKVARGIFEELDKEELRWSPRHQTNQVSIPLDEYKKIKERFGDGGKT